MLQRALRISVVFLLLGLASLSPGQGQAPSQAQDDADVVNQIVLRVNDRIATLYDYLDRRSAMREDILRSDRIGPEEQQRLLADLSKRVMQQIFRDLLLESRADQLEIFVTPDEVEDEIRRMQERNGLSTQEELQEALKTVGLTLDRFRAEFESELRVQRVVGQEVRSQVLLDEDDLRRYYRAHPEEFGIPEKRETVEVVVLDSSSLSGDEQRALANEIVKRLRAGEDLEEVAAPLEEQGQVSSITRFGWIAPGDLDEVLEAALWSLDVGDISDPVPARGGLHILKVIGREEAGVEDFADVRDQIQAKEQNRRFNEALDDYLRELAQTAYIVERIPPDAEGYRNSLTAPLREPFQVLGEGSRTPDTKEPAGEASPPAS